MHKLHLKSKTLRFAAAMLGFTAVLAMLYIAGYCFSRAFIWYPTDSLYLLMKFAQYVAAPCLLLSGWGYLIYRFYFRRPKPPSAQNRITAIRRLKRRTILQYFTSMLIFWAAFFLVIYILQYYVQTVFVWRDDMRMQQAIFDLLVNILFPIGMLGGWVGLTIYWLKKPFSYLLELTQATQQLEEHPEQPITLSDAIKSVQDEYNRLRETSNRNVAAAKEAEQRKNDLVVYLAHDLKTPLTSVIGYLTLLQESPELPPEMRAKYTNIALQKAERLETLVQEFFEITRFQLTHMELEIETICLTRMLEQITFEFQPILSQHDLRWDLRLVPDVMLQCDPDKLERVIDNLIRNAISYSYAGTVIHITLTVAEDEAILCIQNHGKTIAPEKLSRIFEQFFRVDTSRATSTGGAGLGLAIAKQIVSLHGGTITAESADETVTFTVRLPLRKKNV